MATRETDVTRRGKGILSIFEEARAVPGAEQGFADEAGARRVRPYLPPRFGNPSMPLASLGASERVPLDAVYAARVLSDSLAELANGTPVVPREIPTSTKGARPGEVVAVAPVLGPNGGRVSNKADYERIQRAFVALFGVPPERMWEPLLERAIRDAIVVRTALSFARQVVIGELPDELPAPPTAADIRAFVVGMSLPGSVPDYVTPAAIENAFEQCTDADRGGGRGRRRRITVRRWIAALKRTARGPRRSKRTR